MYTVFAPYSSFHTLSPPPHLPLVTNPQALLFSDFVKERAKNDIFACLRYLYKEYIEFLKLFH
jgi:hypothetical protein